MGKYSGNRPFITTRLHSFSHKLSLEESLIKETYISAKRFDKTFLKSLYQSPFLLTNFTFPDSLQNEGGEKMQSEGGAEEAKRRKRK